MLAQLVVVVSGTALVMVIPGPGMVGGSSRSASSRLPSPKYAAALYLIYLGLVSLRSGARTTDFGDADDRRPGRNWLADGCINNVLNPKGALFFGGVLILLGVRMAIAER